MAKFRNDTGSVLNSAEFGVLPPGEFELDGWDPEVHGVIPGCTWLDAPKDAEAAPESDAEAPEAPGDTKTAGKRGKAAGHDKEPGE
jgi:hypothetical protein